MNADALVLTHGAGSNRNAPLLILLDSAFTAAGYLVLRYDLPFRVKRPNGPPSPASAALDRQGLHDAVMGMRARTSGRVFLGGHSYGGRQASMLAAAEPGLADGLLLLSYPLHPPRCPLQLRTAHFPLLQTPAVFVHGTRDPFGSIEELQSAVALIPGTAGLIAIEGAGHDLKRAGVDRTVLDVFQRTFGELTMGAAD